MRIAAGVEYNGRPYFGWQRQSHKPSVQREVELALSKVADHEVLVTCAGRTDAGVHAQGQVIHFDTVAERDERAWLLGANTRLPNDISITWIKPVPDDFHARFKATARHYRYVILNRLARSALFDYQVCWHYHELDAQRMHEAAQVLVGEHDFSGFRAAECQSRSTVRIIEFIKVFRQKEFVYLDIKADAFLHHMVRNIVGTLLPVGGGEAEPEWIGRVLEGRDRKQAGITAPAGGLYFVRAFYPDQYAIPGPTAPISFTGE